MTFRRILTSSLAAVLGLVAVARLYAPAADPPAPVFTAKQVEDFEKEVLPVLKQHCLKCHGAEEKIKGGFKLTSRNSVLAGGDSGPAFDPKDPAASLMLKAIEYKDETNRMPPKGKLPDRELAILSKWIKDGLPYSTDQHDNGAQAKKPKGGVVTPEAKRYWAYQPVQRPAVPETRNKTWVRTPVDAFVLAKLESKGLAPVKSADKVALVRRAYYDLLGLPPTPRQVDAFVNNAAPDAWEKLIDELLASPHYGEKWGRHWLDVVRFAETNGYERDGDKPYAWKYRDYVIQSFNADRRYDEFVREQLAGDEQPGSSPNAVIATGFYRLGLWDDEPADKMQSLFDGYDDLVTVAGQAFLGMTLNCARCHDHKVDPIPQADYYRMLAFFREIRPFSLDQSARGSAFRDVTPPEKRATYEAELQKRQDRLAELTKSMAVLEEAAIKKMPAEAQRASEGADRPTVIDKVPQFLDNEQRRAYSALKRQRAAVDRNAPLSQELALAVNNCDLRPAPVNILVRGSPHSPGKEVQPGFPEVLGSPDPVLAAPKPGVKITGRRTALANWITSPENPLTARVFVNRVWQHHFGRGIVPTANDFGKLGEQPTHPELLNWLTDEFVRPSDPKATPWTLKRLHKLIMMSSVYQLSAAGKPTALKADPANNLYWRFNMRRLSAEEVRDSILAVSGTLNEKMAGPSVYPKIPKEVLAGQSVPGSGWHTSQPDQANSRSVYVFVKRSLQVPILATHDQADTDSSCPVRYTTTVPTQALGLLNGEFANEMAAAFARRLRKDAGDKLDSQVALAIRLTTGRTPVAAEIARDVEFVRAMKEKHGLDDLTALMRYCLLTLNANEFVYLD